MYILGISAYFHDSAACLTCNGEIIAAVQEERFSRIKNDETFPSQSIRYCLNSAGITLAEVDYIVFYEKPFLKFERLLETYLAMAPSGLTSYLKAMPIWIKDKIFLKKKILKALQEIEPDWIADAGKLLFTEHHQSHAASAFYPSPFEKACVLTVDGVGEWCTTSVWYGNDRKLELIKEIKFPHSIGLLYSSFTYYLGFKVNSDEYKVMGLAPYGKPVYKDLILKNLIDLKADGSFKLHLEYFNYCTGLTMTNNRFNLLFGQPVRNSEQEITQFHMDMASSIQQVAEEVMLRIVNHLKLSLNLENLCLAGGVALNCVINGKILSKYPSDGFWIQPASGDAGGALGAALYVYHHYLDRPRKYTGNDSMKNALLGPSCTTEEVMAILEANNVKYERYDDTDFYSVVAKHIDQGKAIGWFKGRMEFGPRSLGARSIIADSRSPTMQSVLNLKIKFRETFRPFAPAVLEEYAGEYFNLSQKSPYMTLVGQVRSSYLTERPKIEVTGFELLKVPRSRFPAITHVDNSARVQTVGSVENPAFYKLLHAFHQLTGCPMIVNTSFNRNNEPIVSSPQDALNCFLNCGLDILAIENLIVDKSSLYK